MQRPTLASSETPEPLKIGEWPWWLEYDYILIWLRLGYLFAAQLMALMISRWVAVLVVLPVLVFLAIRWGLRTIDDRREAHYFWRVKNKICLECGYDLRATPIRCPECGTHTPFWHWLESHPLDKVIYYGGLKPKMKQQQVG